MLLLHTHSPVFFGRLTPSGKQPREAQRFYPGLDVVDRFSFHQGQRPHPRIRRFESFWSVWWRFSSREGFSGPKCMLVCAAGQEQERVSSLAWSGFQDIMIRKHWEQPQTMMSEYQTTAAAVRQFFFRTNHNRGSYSNCSSCPTLHVERTECSYRISSLLGSCLDP